MLAVVNQLYEAQVYDDFVIKSNSAVMKCHIPSFVMDYVSVISWVTEDSTTIDLPIESGIKLSPLYLFFVDTWNFTLLL